MSSVPSSAMIRRAGGLSERMMTGQPMLQELASRHGQHGWIAGAQLSWNLFDGLRTQGKIKETQANYERAGIDLDDRTRGIELEVRTGYSNFIEARKSSSGLGRSPKAQ